MTLPRVSFRPLAPQEPACEGPCALLLATAGCGALAWVRMQLPLPQCAFHAFTGCPCVTCGGTRAAFELFQGHLWRALAWNPLVTILLAGLVLFEGYALVALLNGGRRLRVDGLLPVHKQHARNLLICVIALNWVYVIATQHST